MENIEKGLYAFLESIGKSDAYGTAVQLSNDGTGVKVSTRWLDDQVERWWDESVLGTELNDQQLTDIGAAVDTLTIESNKANIIPNGTDTATITIETIDTVFNGQYSYRIATPEGNLIAGVDTFTAGVATLQLTTQQTGIHEIYIYAGDKGTGRISIGAS